MSARAATLEAAVWPQHERVIVWGRGRPGVRRHELWLDTVNDGDYIYAAIDYTGTGVLNVWGEEVSP